MDEFIFDQTTLLVSEDGENLRSRKTPIAFLASGKYWVNNHAHVLAAAPGFDLRFLFYFVSTFDFDGNGLITGSGQPKLNAANLGCVPVPKLPLAEQQRIARVLGAFDDLIETNRDLARSQEALARALGSRGDGEVAIEELAEVPKLRQRRPTGLVDHFAIPAFDNGQLPAHDLGSTILSGKYVLRQPSVLLSRLNPSTPRTWMAYPGVEEAVCSPEFVVLTGRHGVSTEEVWAVTSSDDFWKQMQSSVGGTTNSRQRVDKAAVPELIVPDVRLLSAEERAAISTLVRGAHELRVEAADLAAHRDELLPLLMSGKVRVSEVEGVA